MTTLNLIPITDTEALRSAGVGYPISEHAWRWLYRNREERGLDTAFVRVGRRILVDVPRYVELARARSSL